MCIRDRELATKDAEIIKEKEMKYFSIHRSEVDLEYSNTLIRETENVDVLIVVTTGNEKKGPFHLTLHGPEKVIRDISPNILAVLDAKGGGKGKRMNAKFGSFANRPKIDSLLEKYFQ